MTFVFRYRYGSLSDIKEGEYTIDSPNLSFAVSDFNQYIASISDVRYPFVVSYFYLCTDDSGKTFLGEFTDSFYKKHFSRYSVR